MTVQLESAGCSQALWTRRLVPLYDLCGCHCSRGTPGGRGTCLCPCLLLPPVRTACCECMASADAAPTTGSPHGGQQQTKAAKVCNMGLLHQTCLHHRKHGAVHEVCMLPVGQLTHLAILVLGGRPQHVCTLHSPVHSAGLLLYLLVVCMAVSIQACRGFIPADINSAR